MTSEYLDIEAFLHSAKTEDVSIANDLKCDMCGETIGEGCDGMCWNRYHEQCWDWDWCEQ